MTPSRLPVSKLSGNSGNQVRLRDIARSVLKSLPHTADTLRGVGTLLRVRLGTQPSVGAVLETHAELQPDATALLFEQQRWSYGQLNTWVNTLAHALRGAGVKPGQTVALLMENHAATLACVAALAKLGA